MRKVKIITITLAIILITLVAFGGVYIKTQNRMEDKVKEYSFGRELEGERLLELKVAKDEDENTQNSDNLTIQNYETVKNTIEKRLESLGAEDYTISLNEKDGTIRVELPEDENTDDFAYYLTASGKVELKEKDAGTELLSDSMIKKSQFTYNVSTEGAYQVYLELTLTEDGQAKLEEKRNDYAVLASEVDEVEKSQKSDEESTDTENEEQTNEETSESSESSETTNESTKKIAVLTIAGTEYDIDKIEKNKLIIKMGSESTNSTTVNNNMAKAAEISMLINSGKYPVDYEVETNRFVYSDIYQEQLIYFALIVAILLLIIFVVFIIKYKVKGLLISISCIGYVAILSLLLRYTNVSISIEGVGAIILVILINLKLNQLILSKLKTINVVSEAVKNSYKELFLKIIPIMIITIVFCFSGWSNLSSFGMIMFWGLALTAIYNIIVTKTLLKLKENK